MFVTESRYGNQFCQPGEILRQAGAERDPPGAAAARHGSARLGSLRRPLPPPGMVGETEAQSWSDTSPGSDRGNTSTRSLKESHSRPIAHHDKRLFSPRWVRWGAAPPPPGAAVAPVPLQSGVGNPRVRDRWVWVPGDRSIPVRSQRSRHRRRSSPAVFAPAVAFVRAFLLAG